MFAIVEIGGVPEATTMSDYFLGTSAFGASQDREPARWPERAAPQTREARPGRAADAITPPAMARPALEVAKGNAPGDPRCRRQAVLPAAL
jgi:hypothetical protein